MNPTDAYQEGERKLASTNNQKGVSARLNDLRSFDRTVHLDGYITDVDPDFHDRYKISVYSGGLGAPATIKNADAISFNPMAILDKWNPCRVIRGESGLFAVLPPSLPLQFFKLKHKYDPTDEDTIRNQVVGWPCAADGTVDSEINVANQSICINATIPESGMSSDQVWELGVVLPWFQYPTPRTLTDPDEGDWRAVGVVMSASGGGEGLFPASGRFKLCQIIDDLTPGTWGADYLRFRVF